MPTRHGLTQGPQDVHHQGGLGGRCNVDLPFDAEKSTKLILTRRSREVRLPDLGDVAIRLSDFRLATKTRTPINSKKLNISR